MDQMTGMEAVARIRESEKGTGKRVPVIGLTSLAGNNSVIQRKNKHTTSS